MDVAVSIQASGFLDPTDVERLGMAHPDLVANSLVLDTWISKPWSPIRRRRWGFGKVSKDRGLSHDRVNPRSMIHFAWKFLTPAERRIAMEAFPQWKSYAALRRFACVHSVAELKEPQVLPADEDEPTALDKHRVWLNSAGLLRFDFNHGDLIRWMGGEYTNRHRDFNADWDVIESKLQNRSIPSDLPPTKLDLAYRIQTEGVPLRGQFTTPMTATGLRNSYDNHPAVDDNLDKVEKKFAKEEWRSYHLHYLRFVYEFIPGLVINPIQWVFDKGKGRICIDCSNGPDPLGSINRYIPSPKEVKAAMEHAKTATEDAQAAKAAENLELECPQVFTSMHFNAFCKGFYRCASRDLMNLSWSMRTISRLLSEEYYITQIWPVLLPMSIQIISWYQWVRFLAPEVHLLITVCWQMFVKLWRLVDQMIPSYILWWHHAPLKLIHLLLWSKFHKTPITRYSLKKSRKVCTMLVLWMIMASWHT